MAIALLTVQDFVILVSKSIPINEIKSVSEFITQLIRIVTFPFSVGAKISIILITCKQHYYNIRAENDYIKIMNTFSTGKNIYLSDSEKEDLLLKIKRCCYEGGFQFRIRIYENPYLKNFIEEMDEIYNNTKAN
jgi:hypothetical protein